MPHLVLLGDSIFDNAAYVAGGPDVLAHVRRLLPAGWEVTLAAVDGAITADLPRQVARMPRSATHLVVSVGGNDALGHVGILDRPARTVAEVLDLLAVLGAEFELDYRAALAPVRATGLPLVLCTIYHGAFPDATLQRRAATALTMFNDAIVRVALEGGEPIVDLRRVCSEPADYANPIEPSVQGGAKIALAIARAVGADGDDAARTVIIAGE